MSRDFRHDTEAEPNMRTSSPVSELVDALMEWSRPDTGSHDAGVQLVCEQAATTLSTRNAELEREVKRLREAQQWHPIETAPKDGTQILVYFDADSDPYYAGEEGKLTAYGAHAEGGDLLDGEGICAAVWVDGWYETTDEYGSGYWMPGWWFAWFNGDTDYVVAPTHWMPLPNQPAALSTSPQGGEHE